MLGKYTEALEDSQTAVKLDPSSVRGYQRAGKALLTMGKLDQVGRSCNGRSCAGRLLVLNDRDYTNGRHRGL